MAFGGFGQGLGVDLAAIKKHLEIGVGWDLAAVKYLSKHANCGCLKPILAELKKTQPKFTFCCHCRETVDLSIITVFSTINVKVLNTAQKSVESLHGRITRMGVLLLWK